MAMNMNYSIHSMRGEVWHAIPGTRGCYQISSRGRVKSVTRYRTYYRTDLSRFVTSLIHERIMKQVIDKDGYIIVGVRGWRRGKFKKRAFLHWLVAVTFVPNPQNKPIVNHIDGDKLNNHPDNLEWVTVKENAVHAARLGIHANMRRGKRLKPSDIPVILDRLKRGDNRHQIASDYNIDITLLYGIKNGYVWRRQVKEWKQIHGEIENKTCKKRHSRFRVPI